jgi:formylglycine-generating enzyme required for sulfatase activity
LGVVTLIVLGIILFGGEIKAVIFPLSVTKGMTTRTATTTRTTSPTFTPLPGTIDTYIRPADAMSMVYVPEGEFLMGSDVGDSFEGPMHSVDLEAYWIDQTEVSNGMYALCVTAGKCDRPSNFSSLTRTSYYNDARFIDYPVVWVDWNDATAYCGWAGARLPTESEWEKAARGTDGRTYPYGEASPSCELVSYYSCNQDTKPVDSYPPGASPYGVLNMSGNVWEWVDTWFGAYPGSPVNPDSFDTTRRVIRGGGYDKSDPRYLSTFYRDHQTPDDRESVIGFRCALSATP